jgi:hypothetical protein
LVGGDVGINKETYGRLIEENLKLKKDIVVLEK